MTLPHTGIRANIPRSTFETDVHDFQPGKLLRVEHPVEATIFDVVQDRDVVLKKAMELINSSR